MSMFQVTIWFFIWRCWHSWTIAQTTPMQNVSWPLTRNNATAILSRQKDAHDKVTARRYKNMDARKKLLMNEQDQIASAEAQGPKRSKEYNPNYGYEPYWADGNWVWTRLPTDDTTGNCGDICSPMYIHYGPVCARSKTFEVRTFPNYCAMKNYDCAGTQAWMVAYRGPCRGRYPTYSTPGDNMVYTRAVVNRAKGLIDAFEKKYPGIL